MATNADIKPQIYDAVESWCHDVISTGHEMLFNEKLFRDALERKSQEKQFPYKVKNSKE
jgi:hypothetical protein